VVSSSENTDQGAIKAKLGFAGRIACALHVGIYSVILAVVVAGVSYCLDVDLSPGRAALALGVTAVTHYLADRRLPLRRLAVMFRHGGAWLDGGGLALLDQPWHIVWLGVAAIILA
jgi:hypothetical protein